MCEITHVLVDDLYKGYVNFFEGRAGNDGEFWAMLIIEWPCRLSVRMLMALGSMSASACCAKSTNASRSLSTVLENENDAVPEDFRPRGTASRSRRFYL